MEAYKQNRIECEWTDTDGQVRDIWLAAQDFVAVRAVLEMEGAKLNVKGERTSHAAGTTRAAAPLAGFPMTPAPTR